MSASQLALRAWFNDGRAMNAAYMLVVYDSLSGDDFPVFTTEETVLTEARSATIAAHNRIMEVYDLNEDRDVQLNEGRTWRLPRDQNTG